MVPTYMKLARTNVQGARYSQDERMRDGVYDCSSFVGRTLNGAGIGIRPDITTYDMNPDKKNAMTKAGFVWHEGMDGVQEGDVLWREGHTEFSAGNGNTIGAHSTKSGVSERPINGKYRGYWRYAGNDVPVTEVAQENPNMDRPSAEQGFTNPSVAQSMQSPAPNTPVSDGFVGYSNMPNFTKSIIDAVGKRNAELAAMTSGMGFQRMLPNPLIG